MQTEMIEYASRNLIINSIISMEVFSSPDFKIKFPAISLTKENTKKYVKIFDRSKNGI